jgi:Flp pilus assembly protein TadG
MRLLTSDRQGSIAVEFAIVAPVFIVIVTASLFYGIYFGAAIIVQQIASEAARAAIAGVTPDERHDLAQTRFDQNASSYPLIDPDHLEFEMVEQAGNILVTVRYDTERLPIHVFAGLLPVPARVISRIGVIDAGG